MAEQGLHKTEARFGLSMPKTSVTNFCLTMLIDVNFLNFLGSNLEYLPLLQEGTTAGVMALGSSYNRPWMV